MFSELSLLHEDTVWRLPSLVLKRLDMATEAVSEDTLHRAVGEEVNKTGSRDICTSGDGTWRKKGFNSLQGVATLVGNKSGKVVDFEAMSLIARNVCCGSINVEPGNILTGLRSILRVVRPIMKGVRGRWKFKEWLKFLADQLKSIV